MARDYGITIPPEPKKVYGSECLDWIDKRIGFACHRSINGTGRHSEGIGSLDSNFGTKVFASENMMSVKTKGYNFSTWLLGWNHDDTKRKVGLVLKRYSDGGLKVALLSTDRVSNLTSIDTQLVYQGALHYVRISEDPSVDLGYKQDPEKPFYNFPNVRQDNIANYEETYSGFSLETDVDENTYATYDETLNFDPTLYEDSHFNGQLGRTWTINGGQDVIGSVAQLTTNKSTTAIFGDGFEITLPNMFHVSNAWLNDPLYLLAGDLFEFVSYEVCLDFLMMCPGKFLSYEDFANFEIASGKILFDTNYTSIPYNIILTENENEALAYLNNGSIPSDAFLFPLDWTNFPHYSAPDDDGSDGDDDNDDGDNNRDIEPNPPSAPQFTPSMFSNYNWYWLTASQFEDFMRWFWFDVGNITDLQDILDKISGMYNNLAEAVLMVRYFPVDVLWIGGEGTPSNIKLAMLEKAGSYKTISTISSPNIRKIGTVAIPSKYNSFVDLSPYSVLSIYLPFHGFVDLDINILSGHNLDVYGVYDHLTGTILYLLYYDDKMLINTFVCKMAVDIPITLQTKNDRDSAIFSNVSNTVSGLMGAGISFASGNPIGLMVGANAFNSGTSTAPLNVKGTIGESGAFYAPDRCYIILRRPTISKPDTWKYNVGQMCGKSYMLSNLTDKGLTTCFQPRITFSSTVPLQTEIDEIYEYLEKGVIL